MNTSGCHCIPPSLSKPIKRAPHLADIPGHDMGMDFGGLDIRMPHEFLRHPDVAPVFQYMSGKAVP
jgi:hypothetical protein